MSDEELLKNAPEIPDRIPIEEDIPKPEFQSPPQKIEEIKVAAEQEIKKADSDYARKRDKVVTIAGLALVFILICMYFNHSSMKNYKNPLNYGAG